MTLDSKRAILARLDYRFTVGKGKNKRENVLVNRVNAHSGTFELGVPPSIDRPKRAYWQRRCFVGARYGASA